MCNCNSNFDGDNEDYSNLSDYSEYEYNNMNEDMDEMDDMDDMDNLVDYDDDEFMTSDDGEMYSNYSDMHEEDEDVDMDSGGVRQYRADGYEALDSVMTDDDDPDYESFDGEAEEGDGEFDDFLTKRSRARRKLRKKLRKGGKSRKEARKEAISKIPKQKLGKLLKNAISGKTDPETNSILKKLKDKGVIKSDDPISKIADEISSSVTENEAEGTQNMGTEGTTTTTEVTETDVTQAGGGKKKMMIIIGIGAIAIIGGYFAFFRGSNK